MSSIAVIGTGYVGLTTAICLAELGHQVTAVDIDEAKVSKLRRGEATIYEPGLQDLMAKGLQGNRLAFTSDYEQAIPSAAFLFGTLLIPESPRFLVFSGKREQARQIFARIGGNADELVAQVQQSLRGEHRPRLSDLIVPGSCRVAPVVWVAMGLAAFQQFVGINIIFYFGEVLWKAAGATEQWALRINLLTGLVNILATIPAIALVDRLGRKPLLLVGSAGWPSLWVSWPSFSRPPAWDRRANLCSVMARR